MTATLTPRTKQRIENARATWLTIAKQYGWASDPFYVQVWLNPDGTVHDSVSFKGMTGDIILHLNHND